MDATRAEWAAGIEQDGARTVKKSFEGGPWITGGFDPVPGAVETGCCGPQPIAGIGCIDLAGRADGTGTSVCELQRRGTSLGW